jgi:glycosyltransferase involved in cell wall biosynthesis
MGRSRAKKQVYRRLIELPTLRRMAAVCALTEAEAAEVRAFGYPGRIEVFPNGVPDPLVDVDAGALRAGLGIDPSDRIGLYVGRIQIDHKRLDAVARAVAAVPGWHLVLVGSDHGGDAQRLCDMVASQAGAERIHFDGPRRGRRLAEAYAGADAFFLMSHSEGMSMALLEALSYGLPAVVSPEVEAALPVADAGAGWATGPAGLTGLLETLRGPGAGDDAHRRAAARRLVADHRWEAIAGRYAGLYREVAAAQGAPR